MIGKYQTFFIQDILSCLHHWVRTYRYFVGLCPTADANKKPCLMGELWSVLHEFIVWSTSCRQGGANGDIQNMTDEIWSNRIIHWGGEKNVRYFPDDIFKCIFLNENAWILINISLKFVPEGPINNIPALVQIMAWRWPGDKPLSEPWWRPMASLLTHICVT